MHLFYTPGLSGETHTLNEEESRHSIKVLRLTTGDTVYLIDGKGGFFEARITLAHPRHCTVEITGQKDWHGKRNHYLHIAIAPTKNIDRTEWFLEKATEIGIDEVTLLLCQHSERKTVKEDRLEKIMIAAMKQSLKAQLPILNPLTPFDAFIRQTFDGKKFIAHCADEEKWLLKNEICQGENVLVLIGPEGDFSPTEIALSLQAGYKPVSLGNSRLRTETAGLVACHTVNLLNE